MENTSKLIFHFTLVDATAFKRYMNFCKKNATPISFRIDASGVKMVQKNDSIYSDNFIENERIISFFFDEKYASHQNFIYDERIVPSHIFTLDILSIRSCITNITKKETISVWQHSDGRNEIKIATSSVQNLNYNYDVHSYVDMIERSASRINPIQGDDPLQSYSHHSVYRRASFMLASSVLTEYFKRLIKSKIKQCSFKVYEKGFSFESVSRVNSLSNDFRYGTIEPSQFLFEKSLDNFSIPSIFEMCSITSAGITMIFVDPIKKMIRFSCFVTYISSINLYLLPESEDDEPIGRLEYKTVYQEKSDAEEEYSEDED